MAILYKFEDEKFSLKHSIDEKPKETEFNTMHTHDEYELYIFLNGKGIYYVEGTPYNLSFGDIIILNRNESHCVKINEKHPYERIVIFFNSDLFSNGLEELLSPFTSRPIGKFNKFNIKNLFGPEYKKYLDKLVDKNSDKTTIFLEFLYLLSSLRQKYNLKDEDLEESTLSSEIVCFVNENLSRKISLESICDKFFISKSQLLRIFKTATGATVWDYIVTKRLILARELINEGQRITDACYNAGFNDYTSFYRAYKNRYGTPPKKHKK